MRSARLWIIEQLWRGFMTLKIWNSPSQEKSNLRLCRESNLLIFSIRKFSILCSRQISLFFSLLFEKTKRIFFKCKFLPFVLNIQFFYCLWSFEDSSLCLETLHIRRSEDMKFYYFDIFYSPKSFHLFASFFFEHWMFKDLLVKDNSCLYNIGLFLTYFDEWRCEVLKYLEGLLGLNLGYSCLLKGVRALKSSCWFVEKIKGERLDKEVFFWWKSNIINRIL